MDTKLKGIHEPKAYLDQQLEDPEVRLAFEQDWLHQEFVSQLELRMKRKHLNRRRLAIRMRRTPAFVTKALRQGQNLTMNTMVELAYTAGLRIRLDLVELEAMPKPVSSYGEHLVWLVSCTSAPHKDQEGEPAASGPPPCFFVVPQDNEPSESQFLHCRKSDKTPSRAAIWDLDAYSCPLVTNCLGER